MDPLRRSFLRFRDHGDTDALGSVFDALSPRLLALALHLCGRPNDAEDLLQQTFVQAMRLAAHYDASRPLEPWLCGLLTNLARNQRRYEARRTCAELVEDGVPSLEVRPDSAAERRELVALLRTHIDSLTAEQRQVLVLQLQHGLSPTEIADALGVPPGAVRMRLHRGLAALRKLLPVGVASWLSAATAPGGIAAVRREVLAAARELLPTGMGVGGMLMAGNAAWKALVLVAVVAVAALGLQQWLAPGIDAAAGSTATPPAALVRGTATVAEPTVTRLPEPAAPEKPAERVAADAVKRGALRVRVTAVDPGEPGSPAPLADVEVMLRHLDSGTGELQRGRTDASGFAEFRAITTGAWEAIAFYDGMFAENCTVEPGARAEVALVATLTERARGLVVDADERPVAGAEVWVTFAGLTEPVRANARCASRSDADGRFDVRLAAGGLYIGASKAGHAAAWRQYLQPGATGEVRLVLGRAGGTLRGQVLTADGTAAAAVDVLVAAAEWRGRRLADGRFASGPATAVATTDARGAFVVEGLRAGDYECSTGLAPEAPRAQVAVPALGSAEVTLRLPPPPTGVPVRGNVRRTGGEPLVLDVRLVAAGIAVGSQSTFSDGAGQFHGLRAPDAEVKVQALRDGVVLAERTFSPPLGTELVCEIVVAEPLAARGVLLGPNERPLGGWRVRAEFPDRALEPVVVGDDGSFVLWGTGTGPLQIVAGTGEGVDPSMRPMHTFGPIVPGSERLRLVMPESSMPNGELTGVVTDANGQALAEAQVALVDDDGRQLDLAVDAAGRFRGVGIAPGAHRLRIAAPRGAARELAVDVRNAGLVDLGEIALAASATLRLRPLRADGSVWSVDVPDVELTDATGQRVSLPFHSIVEGGERVLTGVPVGHWLVQPRAGECVLGAPIAVELRADATVVADWPLRIGLGVELVFEVPKGELAAAAAERLQVRIRDAQGGSVGPFDGSFDADRPGGFALVHTFDVGSYEIEAETQSGRRYRGGMLVRSVQEDPTRFVVAPMR